MSFTWPPFHISIGIFVLVIIALLALLGACHGGLDFHFGTNVGFGRG